MRKLMMAAAAGGLMLSGVAAAKKAPETKVPASVQRLLACRGLADGAARLACFDRETAGIDQSLAKRDLVVIDRERVTQSRRELFGFSVPSFGGLFGGGGEDEIKQIESTVVSWGGNADGGWIIRLADGSRWSQTDGTTLALPPERGQKVVVRRGALGSYRLSVNGQPGMKVERIG
ncbi:hypothetical protein [Sphingomonas sp.]|uniref:hypothetical protein n=1 Tax=Sphingomonas sp. TaxID=28214 RepID=UPI00286DE5A7|nr:hypothetical protein [Sphingomonas sp.]